MSNLRPVTELPAWVPDAVRLYLSHTTEGRSLRDLARDAGCHPSTVLRQVRRFENRREDPLIDLALARLDTRFQPATGAAGATSAPTTERPAGSGGSAGAGVSHGSSDAASARPAKAGAPSRKDRVDALFRRDAPRLLRRLAERDALLAVAPEMDKAVILREESDGRTHRLAVLDRRIAEAFALREWIACRQNGRVSSYAITPQGRAALRQMLGDSDTTLDDSSDADPECNVFLPPLDRSRTRNLGAESPIAVLARRRGRNGSAFLGADLVAVAERLREDFELAQLGQDAQINWEEWMTQSPARQTDDRAALSASDAARMRVLSALADLGPGLGDMVLRCCCYLEGLEAAERRMGWSARSGKIVLRIALQRLKLHYNRLGDAHKMIG